MPSSSGSGRSKEKEEDSKAAVKPLLVTVKVVSQGLDKVVRHTMSMTDKLQVLMDVWYHKVPDATYGTGVFLYDGLRLPADKTPADLEMESEDMIDFFEHMDGGAGPLLDDVSMSTC